MFFITSKAQFLLSAWRPSLTAATKMVYRPIYFKEENATRGKCLLNICFRLTLIPSSSHEIKSRSFIKRFGNRFNQMNILAF